MKATFLFVIITSLGFAQTDQEEKIRKYIFLAEKQFEKGNESKTYDFIAQAIALKPDSCELHQLKSDYYFKFQRMALAIEAIEESMVQFPKCKLLHDQKIFYHQFLGDSIQTMVTIQKGIKTFAGNSEALIDFYLKKSNYLTNYKAYNDAIIVVDSALNIKKNNAEANRLKGFLLFKSNKTTEGLALIKSNLRTNNSIADFVIYTQCLIENNQLNEAKVILDSLSNQKLESDDLSDISNQLGIIALKNENLEIAESQFQKSISSNTGNSMAYKNLALTYIAKKQYEKVCTNLKKALYLGYTKMYDDEAKELVQKHCR